MWRSEFERRLYSLSENPNKCLISPWHHLEMALKILIRDFGESALRDFLLVSPLVSTTEPPAASMNRVVRWVG
jgi:hypothetical protein